MPAIQLMLWIVRSRPGCGGAGHMGRQRLGVSAPTVCCSEQRAAAAPAGGRPAQAGLCFDEMAGSTPTAGTETTEEPDKSFTPETSLIFRGERRPRRGPCSLQATAGAQRARYRKSWPEEGEREETSNFSSSQISRVQDTYFHITEMV
eukprot:3523908-Rhodomonas_salina.1